MADNIVTIDFTNVEVDGEPITGSVEINYTTGEATGELSAHIPVIGGDVTFTNFTLVDNGGGNYSLHVDSAIPGIYASFNFTGQEPTSFTSAAVHIGPDTIPLTVDPNDLTSVCFAAGTLIRTPGGDVAVETLEAGDLVVTASGALRPVKWMGHKDVDFRRTPGASPGQPIRVAAGAFGPGRPSQDLYLSAGHAVCVDLVGEVLIPVGELVNGGTIAPVEVETISYWHVELDSHDVLVANNLPAESYLAMGNRGAFEEKRGLLPAMVEGRGRSHADFCRPVVTEGPLLGFVRQRLAAQAEALGWKRSADADLRLVADGETIRPRIESGRATFAFPAKARDVRLLSRTFCPAMAGTGSNDRRTLGVMLCALAFGGAPIALDDERLRDGVHQFERHGDAPRRWTNGAMVLDPALWGDEAGEASLVVHYDVATLRGWVAPAGRVERAPSASRPKLRAVG